MAYTSNLYVVAAICGNFWQESTVNPGVWENTTVGDPGYGLGQWTDNSQTSRRTALFNYLDANGYARDSGEGQLNFLVYENVWVPSLIEPSAYSTLTDYFNSRSINITDLVHEFMYHWEGINDGSVQTRIDFANRCYNVFINDDGTRYPWTTGNFLIDSRYALRNCLLIKDFFVGTIPPPPPPPPPHSRRKGLKPWFIEYILKR